MLYPLHFGNVYLGGPDSVESQTDRTAQYLRDAIVAGHLRPNQLLVAAEIAAKLGVSRTPVREALQRLLQEGYATKLSNGFCVVVDHQVSEMHESLEVETYLLKLAAKLVCERGSEDSLRTMDSFYGQMESAIASAGLEQWTAAAQGWVNALFVASGSGVLMSVMDGLKVHYWRHRWSRSFRVADCQEVTARYKRVADALRAGDIERAEEAITDLGQAVGRYASMWSVETEPVVEINTNEGHKSREV
jgi:DNA-binding GntR family transcriptional regulator